MHLVRTKPPVLLALFAAIFFTVTSLWAEGDYILTGSGIRVKTIAFIDIKVYAISHYMKQLPATKSKRAVIDMDTDKKFVWTMKRDVDHEKIIKALKDAYALNGYTDSAKIGQLIGAFKGELKENSSVSIVYNADQKTTTVTVAGGGSATVSGVDFMKATWSIWFGKIDQPDLGDKLINKIP
jgi:hypothetical protein